MHDLPHTIQPRPQPGRSPDGPPTSPNPVTATKRPPPPINHNIQILTAAFQDAILENDIFELTTLYLQYSLAMRNDLEV